MKLLGLISILAILRAVHGQNVDILDRFDKPLVRIVQDVCWYSTGKGKQISKISTVALIAEYLGSLPASSGKLASCSRIYLNSVKDLASLLSISNDNVCSHQKISAIQQYHRKYILKDFRTGKAPQILETFFQHYVSSISQICARDATQFLNDLQIHTSESETSEPDQVLNELATFTGVPSSSNLKHEDIFLTWTVIDMLPLQGQYEIEKYLFSGKKRVVMSAKNVEELVEIQEFCSKKAKPLYSRSLLPTIKLIDMGYYPSNSILLKLLNYNKAARKFFELTKICEALLPIKLVKQVFRTDSDFVLMSRGQVESMGLSAYLGCPKPEVTGESCKTCSLEDDALHTVNSVDAIAVATRVKSEVENRRGATASLMKMLVEVGKTNVVGAVRKLFSGTRVPMGLEDINVNQLDENESRRIIEKSKPNFISMFTSFALETQRIIGVVFIYAALLMRYISTLPFVGIQKFINWASRAFK